MEKELLEKILELILDRKHGLKASEILTRANIHGMTARKLSDILSKTEGVVDVSDYGAKSFSYLGDDSNRLDKTGKIEKDKNILKIYLANGEYFTYDFNTKKFNNRPKLLKTELEYLTPVALLLQCNINTEWIYNYIDKIDLGFDWRTKNFLLPKTCPKGYLKYLENTNGCISPITLMEYDLVNRHSNKLNIRTINNIKDSRIFYGYGYSYKERIAKLDKVLTTLEEIDLVKLVTNSIKIMENINLHSDVNNLIEVISELEERKIEYSIDYNRGLDYNLQLLKDLKHKEFLNQLSKNLQKLNFINGIQIGDYQVVVPQNIYDLRNEGEQQHNCVGSFYNESIVDGYNLIYFLRKKDNLNKSVVTCRYNTSAKETTEYRTTCNRSTSEEQNEIVEKIDKLIKAELGE